MLVTSFAALPVLADLPRPFVRLVQAVRLWGVAARLRRCPIHAAGDRLGSVRAGAHLHLLMEEIGAAWPEAFCISPPCAPRLSHDEATLIGLVAHAARGDRPAADRLLADLLPGDARERLYMSATMISGLLHD